MQSLEIAHHLLLHPYADTPFLKESSSSLVHKSRFLVCDTRGTVYDPFGASGRSAMIQNHTDTRESKKTGKKGKWERKKEKKRDRKETEKTDENKTKIKKKTKKYGNRLKKETKNNERQQTD